MKPYVVLRRTSVIYGFTLLNTVESLEIDRQFLIVFSVFENENVIDRCNAIVVVNKENKV